MRTPLSVGVVGLDANGIEYASTLADLPQVNVRWLCDERIAPRQRTARRFPAARVTKDPTDLLEDESLDAIVIASGGRPALASAALTSDKHVLTTLPLAYTGTDATELVRLAQGRGRALVVADTLVAQPAAGELKELIETGGLGEVYSLYVNRQGIPRERPADEGVWTFGADELSLLLYLLDDEPIDVVARGESYSEPGVVDVISCSLLFATGISAHLHLSWLDPQGIRRLTAIGSQRLAVLDSLAPERKLTIYEQITADGSIGDIRSPRIEPGDPVRLECERWVAAVRSSTPRSTAVELTGQRAVAVVRVLESVAESLDRKQRASQPVEHAAAALGQVVPLRPPA
jgi:predicted dehydrogenase